jgi:transglutaminase-like putative cysteine protease
MSPRWPIPLLYRPVRRGPSLSPAFLSTWRYFTLALLMLGFLALAVTGELGPVVIALYCALWLIGLVGPRVPRWFRPWMGLLVFWIVLFVIAVLGLQFKFISLLYLLLLLGSVKCLTLREPVDHIQAMLIAFVMLLACSSITNSVSYIGFMLGFIVLVMLGLICYTVAQEAGSMALDGASRDDAGHLLVHERGLFRRVFVSNLAVALLVMIVAHLLFFLMPHYATQHGFQSFGQEEQAEEAVSGFNENLDLNAISRLALDNTRVMTVGIEWTGRPGRLPPESLRLRGSNLAVFDDQGWRTLTPTTAKRSRRWSLIHLPLSVSDRAPVLIQTIQQDPSRLQRLFGAGDAYLVHLLANVEVNINYRVESLDVRPYTHLRDFTYQVHSVIPPDAMMSLAQVVGALRNQPNVDELLALPELEQMKRLSAETARFPQVDPELYMRDSDREIYTRLPDSRLTETISEIADARVRGPSAPDRIVNLNRWFSAAYEYSLVPDTPRGMHPLEAFLLYTHKGHCEYFASSMVLLLRAKGIPSRVVTGYYTTEYQAATREFIVRQSDAHAWCEVWLDGLGWLPLDPTPPIYRGRNSFQTYHPPFLKSLADRMRSFWQLYILDYSNSAKAELLDRFLQRPLTEHVGNLSQALRNLMVNHLSDQSLGRHEFLRIGGKSLVPLLRSLIAVTLLALLWLYYRRHWRRRRAADRNLSPVVFMNELLERLAALGWSRRPGQTPAELIHDIDRQTQGRWALGAVVDLYHRCRYANAHPSAEDLALVHRTIRDIQL